MTVVRPAAPGIDRRRFLTASLLGLGGLALAGCQSVGDDSGSAATTVVSSPVDRAEMIGRALGQSDEIAALGADVADQVAQAAADNPAFEGKTVSVVWPKEDGSWFAWSTTDPRVELMESLGLVQSPEIEALGTDAFFHTVSAENTPQIDADVIVLLDVDGVKSTVEANPVFNSLDAVKNGQVVLVTDPNVIGALSYGSVLSLPYAIDAIVPALAETIGGAAVSSSAVVTTG
jgi:iron complex transport system substrate-binding protein